MCCSIWADRKQEPILKNILNRIERSAFLSTVASLSSSLHRSFLASALPPFQKPRSWQLQLGVRYHECSLPCNPLDRDKERRSQRLELSTSCSKHGINLYTRLLRHRIEGLPCEHQRMLTQTFLFSLGLLLPRGSNFFILVSRRGKAFISLLGT